MKLFIEIPYPDFFQEIKAQSREDESDCRDNSAYVRVFNFDHQKEYEDYQICGDSNSNSPGVASFPCLIRLNFLIPFFERCYFLLKDFNLIHVP